MYYINLGKVKLFSFIFQAIISCSKILCACILAGNKENIIIRISTITYTPLIILVRILLTRYVRSLLFQQYICFLVIFFKDFLYF